MRKQQAGFLFLITLFALTGVLTLTVASLSRSLNETTAATRFVNKAKAFQAAEAGFDEAFWELANSSGDFTKAETWVDGTASDDAACATSPCRKKPVGLGTGPSAPSATVIVIDPQGAIPTIKVLGVATGTPQRIVAKVQRPGGPSAFDYAVSGTTLNLNGTAIIGQSLNRVPRIYAQGPPDATGDIAAGANNEVWADRIDFYNPTNLPLGTLCSRCTDGTIFHQPVAFNLAAPQLPPIQMDLKPYYANMTRHITTDTTIANQTIEGVIYVECGVTLTFTGNVTVNGTIVHEGCNGHINIANHGDQLTINSFGGAHPFAPGLAIVGAPSLGFGNGTFLDVNGFIMHHGPASIFKASGTIQGGLISVDEKAVRDNYPEVVSNTNGPGSYDSITFAFARVGIDSGTHITFLALSSNPPGLPNSSSAPKVLFWQNE